MILNYSRFVSFNVSARIEELFEETSSQHKNLIVLRRKQSAEMRIAI